MGTGPTAAILADKAFYVALLMAAFAIVFGTRNIDAAEHHQGMVVAVAFESVVKLLSFLAVGVMVVWGIMTASPTCSTGRRRIRKSPDC